MTETPAVKRSKTEVEPRFPSPALLEKMKTQPRLPEGPVFYPSEEEFIDPMKYISSIKEIGQKYGVCKIVPPSDKWLQGTHFTKEVDPKNFIFQTKGQNIHQLMNRSGPCAKFLEELEAFLQTKDIQMKNLPVLDGQELDLYKLYHSVVSKGGVQQVIQNKKWKEVARELKLSTDCTSAGFTLKQNYFKYLSDFEQYQKTKQEQAQILNKEEKDSSLLDASQKSKISPVKEEEENFGYHDGRMFTLQSFKKMATNFQKKWLKEGTSPQDVEDLYWHIVESSEEFVQVHYGSDLDVGQHGSGFPTSPQLLKNASGWNLNLFPKLPGSLLQYIDEDIIGVNKPMMYIGMLFSTFCWHVEDNNLYSINYLHHGAPKTWYGIPSTSAEHFEKVMKKTVPELFSANPDLLFLLITMLPPRTLIREEVPTYHLLQEAGEFVITFPKAYHAGFSHGFTCAESSNFALDDWIPLGRESYSRYRAFARSSVLSLEKLLVKIATSNIDDRDIAERLKTEFPLMRKTEQSLREEAMNKGVWKWMNFDDWDSSDVKECSICKFDCYLSGIVCPCSSTKVACINHMDQLCDCPASRKTLLFRWTMSELMDLERKVLGEHYPKAIGGGESPEKDNRVNHSSNSPTRNGKMNNVRTNRSPPATKSISKPIIRKLARTGGRCCLKGIDYTPLKSSIDEQMYIVEKILDERKTKGKLEYLLKWRGFPETEGTWEVADELNCPGLIADFNRRMGRQMPELVKRSPRKNKGRRRSMMSRM